MIKNLVKKIRADVGLKRYFYNTSWLYLVQGVRLLAGFFVGLWLARYLGPSDFGIYNYVTSFGSIFLSLAIMGVGETLIKKIIENDQDRIAILNAGFVIRFVSGVLSICVLIVTLFFLPIEMGIIKLIVVLSPILIFQAFDVVDDFFSARVMVKESAKWRMTQIILSSFIKIYLIFLGAPVSAFIWMGVFDCFFYSCVIYFHFSRTFSDFVFLKPNKKIVLLLFQESLPIMVISLSTVLFVRMGQLMLGSMVSQFELGLYSSAIRIIDMMTIFLAITAQSFFPAIVSAKKTSPEMYLSRFVSLSRLLVGSACFMSLGVGLFSKDIITILYGEQYESSHRLLAILSLNTVFVGMSLISYRWYVVENLQKIMMLKIIGLVFFNFLLNLALIPSYGVVGVAYSSLISHFVFYFLFELFFKKTRQCFWINFLINKNASSKLPE